MTDTDDRGQFPLFEPVEEYEQGKDELNIAEYPLSLAGKTLAPRKGERASMVTFTDRVRDKSSGRLVERKVTITASPEYGLPTYYDEEVLFGILQLTHRRRREDPAGGWPKVVSFSRYELAKLLGLKHGGEAYRRLSRSIRRLGTTTYEFAYAWFDHANEKWKAGVGVNFLQKFEWDEPPEGIRGTEGRFTITWNDDIHRSFEAGYLRDINYLEYRAMRLPLAKALYRFLGKHFWRRRQLSFDLRTLAHEKLGLSREYDTGQIKRALAPAIRRLEERGYVDPLPRERRYTKVRVGEWRVHFTLAAERPPTAGVLDEALPSDLEQRLADAGVSRGVAAELVADHPAELIERKLDVLAWLDDQKRPPKTSRGGFLAQSIREGWDDPDGYVTREVRQAAEKVEQEKREAAKARRVAEKEAERAYDKAAAEREKLARRRLKAMTDAERDVLRREALGESPNRLQVRHAETFMLAQLIEQMEAAGDLPPLPNKP